MLEMLQSPSGAAIEEMADATGWQCHTVRRAMNNALKKRPPGLTIISDKPEQDLVSTECCPLRICDDVPHSQELNCKERDLI